LLTTLQLDGFDELGEPEFSGLEVLPFAIRMSRKVRAKLNFPKHSAANEAVVSDWVQRNWPAGTREYQKREALPWIIKLAFVKSRREIEAEQLFGYLGALVDRA
jgi:hypothetical protein